MILQIRLSDPDISARITRIAIEMKYAKRLHRARNVQPFLGIYQGLSCENVI